MTQQDDKVGGTPKSPENVLTSSLVHLCAMKFLG